MELIEKQHFDVVLAEAFCDNALPKNWISLLQAKYRTLEEPVRTQFILLTGVTDDKAVRESLGRGYTDIMSTPVDLSILLQKASAFYSLQAVPKGELALRTGRQRTMRDQHQRPDCKSGRVWRHDPHRPRVFSGPSDHDVQRNGGRR